MTFLDKFTLLTQRKGLSPRAVALHVGFDPSAIAQWKKRGSRPNPATAAQLAAFFEVGVEDLMEDGRELPGWEAPSGGGGGGPAVSPSGLGGGQAELLVELRLLRAEVAALRQEQQQLQLALAQSDRARRAG